MARAQRLLARQLEKQQDATRALTDAIEAASRQKSRSQEFKGKFELLSGSCVSCFACGA